MGSLTITAMLNSEYCCYCERGLTIFNFTKEHLIPKSRGGNGTVLNKKPCCKKCNNERGSLPLTAWLEKLKRKEAAINLTNKEIKKLEIQIANVEYWIQYTALNGASLYKNQKYFAKHAEKYSAPLVKHKKAV